MKVVRYEVLGIDGRRHHRSTDEAAARELYGKLAASHPVELVRVEPLEQSASFELEDAQRRRTLAPWQQ